ncbi:BTAD domain-containing putative transcriptional regulator [Streptomyces sp. NPDC051940]|uniref:AfsR/SARP family transcriptional regulator n=1 Tax=Streptomyces sp. NPDC051940 TaxID=3155675 RepID=UPI003425A1F8
MGERLEFRLLGPVEVWSGRRRLGPMARKPTELLAAGLLEAGRMVPVARLVDAVWGDDPPATAAKLVQTYVAALRRVLRHPDGQSVIVTRPGGYLFQPGPDCLDLHRFENLLDRALAESERGAPSVAAELLEQALGLWTGPALGAPGTPLLLAEANRLEELRDTAAEHLYEARLATGQGTQLVGGLAALVAAQPLRERPRALLMRALYESGRRAEALACYGEGYRLLRDELGVAPGPELAALHARMLTDGPPGGRARGGAADRAAHRVPAQLPWGPAELVGRDAESAAVLAALDGAAKGRGTVCVVHGMGGVGKTALTLHVAHLAASRFPDGQLHVDLRGADPRQAADPREVLGRFLRALGVRPGDVPDSVAERAAAYRSELAVRQVLVVLDDAADEGQVAPLLPGAGGSAGLVTGRRGLPGVEADLRLRLRVLDVRDAARLLGRVAGADAVCTEPAAADRVARLCGGLPLALRIVGTRLAGLGGTPMRVLAERLADERRRLDEMRVGSLDVRAGIALTCGTLPETERLAFRLLGLLGPVDFPGWTAAPLLQVPVPVAERLVERLVEAHLLDAVGADGTGQIRYRFHDLVRLHAEELARTGIPAAERRAAVDRLLGLWLELLDACATPGRPTPTRPAVPDVLDRPAAWLAADRTLHVAGVELACREGLDSSACALAKALAEHWYRDANRFEEWWRTQEAALAAARASGNRRGEAEMYLGLAQLRYKQDRFADATRHFHQAGDCFDALDLPAEASRARYGLALALSDQGFFAEALAHARAAGAGFRATGDVRGEADARYAAGFVLRDLGRFAEAMEELRAALDTYRTVGDRRAEALALRSVGLVHRARGEFDPAEEHCAEALRLLGEAGDRHMTAYAVQAHAKACFRRSPGSVAPDALLEALRVCHELDDRFGQALMVRTLGELHLAAGRLADAEVCLGHALLQWKELSMPVFQARTQRDLAVLHERRGEHEAGQALRLEALEVFRLYGTHERGELPSGS